MSESNPATKAAHAQARALAAALFRGPCLNPKNTGETITRCLEREEKRPLTSTEKRKGWHRRPWYAYDHEALCRGCVAYWHAELCAIALDDVVACGLSIVPDESGVSTSRACLACGRAACGFRDDVNMGKCTCGRYPATPAPTPACYPMAAL